MLFFVILGVLAATIVTVAVIKKIVIPQKAKKYFKFVSEHSTAVQTIKKINAEYTFFDVKRFDEEHTYDNDKIFENVSCQDYLIYQLQFKKDYFITQFDLAKRNNERYKAYCAEINSKCRPGEFDCEIGSLDRKRLLAIEKQEVEKRIKYPRVEFRIVVTLYLARMNGQVYDKKSEVFDERNVYALLSRLQNKSGAYYRDRAIWDALCRVERGRVSNKMRFAVMERDGYRCCHCGRAEGTAGDLEIDHIIPISKGGKSTFENLQTLCHRCNVEKGNRF